MLNNAHVNIISLTNSVREKGIHTHSHEILFSQSCEKHTDHFSEALNAAVCLPYIRDHSQKVYFSQMSNSNAVKFRLECHFSIYII